MKKFTVTVLTSAIALASAASSYAAQLADKDKQFLTNYERVHHALASDDLAAAKTAAKSLGEEGSEVAGASSLADARAAFEKLSSRAKTTATGESGYYVVHCPMLKKDWVQTSTTVENPYGGKEMIGCGEIQK